MKAATSFRNRNNVIQELESEYPGFGFIEHYEGYLKIKESNRLRDNEVEEIKIGKSWLPPNPNIIMGYSV